MGGISFAGLLGIVVVPSYGSGGKTCTFGKTVQQVLTYFFVSSLFKMWGR